jgi:hypothetical protein
MNFITFGTYDYDKQIKRITSEASTFGCFKTVTGIYPYMLEKPFLDKHETFMQNNKRGHGFWIWKPQIVLQSLNSIPDGEVIVYADSGCTMNRYGINKLYEYVNKAKYHSKTGVVCFQMLPHLEEEWTKQKLFNILDCESYKKTPQIHATTFIIKKCPESMKLVEEWSYYSQKHELINEEDRSEQQSPPFIDFRHDQSIWSLLNKKHGSFIIQNDETYPPTNETPIWGTRIRKDHDTSFPHLSKA